MRPELNPFNIGNIARGAAVELFDKNIGKIGENIADKSTDAKRKRSLTITFDFYPDDERRRIIVKTKAKVSLAAITEHESTGYIGKDADGNVFLFDQDPRQDILFEAPKPDSKVLEFGTQPSQ